MPQQKLVELISAETGKKWSKSNKKTSAHLVSVFSQRFSFPIAIRNAGIRIVYSINDAKNPRRHKILLPRRKHSPKSTEKFRRPETIRSKLFSIGSILCVQCVCVCVCAAMFLWVHFIPSGDRQWDSNSSIFKSAELFYYFLGRSVNIFSRDFWLIHDTEEVFVVLLF